MATNFFPSKKSGVSIANRNPITGQIQGGRQYNPNGSTVTFNRSGQGTSYGGGGSSNQAQIIAQQQEVARQAEVQRQEQLRIEKAKSEAQRVREAEAKKNLLVNYKIKQELAASGLRAIESNRQVVGFTSPDTRKSYSYTDSGFNNYNKDSQQSGARFRQSIRESVKASENSKQSIMSPVEKNKVRALSNSWAKSIESLSNQIRQSAANRDIQKLGNLQRRGSNLTASQRAEKARLSRKVSENYKNVGKVLGYAMAASVLNLGIGGYDLANAMRRNPLGTLKSLPGNLARGILNDSKRFIRDPLGSLTVASEYAAMGGALKVVGKGARATLRGLSKVGGTITGDLVTETVGGFNIKKAGLTLKKQTVASGSRSLARQTEVAGKRVTAVTAQANQLVSLIRRNKIIRKPITGEASFPASIKRLLKKFDAGERLSTKEFARTNMWLRRNVAPNITLLERSLYLDPAKGLRVSRLGIEAERTAGLRDIIRGNFKLFRNPNKPQVLIFENAQVARFPKALRTIERKLKTGKTLTTAETNKLIRWQVQTGSGKFKPIGSTIYAGGRELEVTLAPGEMIKRIKKVGFTYIKGKKVTFVTAEVYKPGAAILKKIRLAQIGKLSRSALERLENFLSRKLGRKIRIETPTRIGKNLKRDARALRRMDPSIPVLRVRGPGLFVLSRGRFGGATLGRRAFGVRSTSGRVVRRTTSGRTARPGRPTPRIPRRPNRPGRLRVHGRPRIPVRPTRPGRPGRPGSPPPKIPFRIKLNEFKTQRLSSAIPTFYVVEKVRGKFKKLYPKPLTLKDARDYAVYSIDNRLSKTAFFVPLGKAKRVVRPPRQIQNYASRNSFKVRPYRIRFGKKRKLVNGFIEKRRFFQDTIGERRALRVARKISPQRRRQLIKQLQKARSARFGNRPRMQRRITSQRTQRIVRRRTRTISPSQRRVLLLRLKKARAVRMRNLRRR